MADEEMSILDVLEVKRQQVKAEEEENEHMHNEAVKLLRTIEDWLFEVYQKDPQQVDYVSAEEAIDIHSNEFVPSRLKIDGAQISIRFANGRKACIRYEAEDWKCWIIVDSDGTTQPFNKTSFSWMIVKLK